MINLETDGNGNGAAHSHPDGDFSFDEVLMCIESGETVPVVGPELLTDPSGNGFTLHDAMAAPLAKALNVDLTKVKDPKSLSMIIVESAMFRNKRQMVYPTLKGVLDKLIKSFPVPEPLRKLAEITPIQLFLSTTFDPLMMMALTQARGCNGNGSSTLSLAFSPDRFDDLPPNWNESPRPTVYHLFGRASLLQEYATTEGDVLEYIHTMQSREGRLPHLFDKLHRSNLLLLGVGFPDWLYRFFLRLTKNSRLWETRERIEVVAENRFTQNENQVYFFKQFSRETTIFGGGAVEFVNGLYDRWREKQKQDTGFMRRPLELPDDMKPGAVFISYASDNREEAQRIRDKLQGRGIDVWYDREELHAGNYYEPKIRNNIRTCSLFVPVISAQARDRTDGFFRREWCWATDRLPDFFGTDRPFILPVVVDRTQPGHGQLPESFNRVQWIDAPRGDLPDDSIERVKEALMSVRKLERKNA